MSKQDITNEPQNNDIASVIVNKGNDKESKVALQLQFNYGANIVFDKYVFEPNKEVILTEAEVKKLEKNSNFLHYISSNIIKKYIPIVK